MKKIRVLVIEGSPHIGRVLTETLSLDPGIEIVGVVQDPLQAGEHVKLAEPDVLALDVELPRMHGLTLLEMLLKQRPLPVVVVAPSTEQGGDTIRAALELGAVDYVLKPNPYVLQDLGGLMPELVLKIKAAAQVRVRERGVGAARDRACAQPKTTACKVLAIGAATGSSEALRSVLAALPRDCPGVVVAQHMPANLSSAFADRCNQTSQIEVVEAKDGDLVIPGRALIAPTDHHMLLVRRDGGYSVRINQTQRVNRQRPSVDVLFESVAEVAGANAVGVMLTGMGDDGARGLLQMREAGAYTIAQDRRTSALFGMPREAITRAAVQVLPLNAIPRAAFARAMWRP